VGRLFAVPLIACLSAIAIVLAFARDRAPAPYTIAALIATAVAYVPFVRSSSPRIHAMGLAAFGVLTIPIGWMFGANSASGAVFTLIILLVGVRYSSLGAWLFYATTAAGQALVAALVLAGVLGDDSILPLIVPDHPMWHHAIAHGALQLVYLTAFLAGRAFQSRYRRLSSDLDTAIQIAARRASLLDEARAEYLRTLALGRQGIFSGHMIGTFRLGDVIGRGGAGEVYDARAEDGTIVAMKLLRGDRLRDAAAIQSFIAESNAAMRIVSPHVAQAKQVGGLDAAMPYLAMEKLDGTTLRAMLLERGALSRDELRALISDACAALTAVHAASLAHGDVSPQNLMNTSSGWKLIDFGSRASVGTPRFVAPELLANPDEKPTSSTDLYGLTACLYAAATGEEPFAEVPQAQLAHVVSTRMPLDPRLQSDVSDEVARALQRGLATAATDRFANVDELRSAFVGALDSAPGPSPRAMKLPSWSVAPPTYEAEPTDEITRAARASQPSIRRSEPAIRKSAPQIRESESDARIASDPVVTDGAHVGASALRESDARIASVPVLANSAYVGASAPHTSVASRVESESVDDAHVGASASHASDRAAATRDKATRDTSRAIERIDVPTPSVERIDEATPSGERIDATIDATRDAAWEGAFRDKARRQRAGVLGLCIGGAILLGFIVREREALWAAWIGIAGIAVTMFFNRKSETWPWVIVGVLSVGPAFALGLHSAFAAVVALGLFAGRLFRAPWKARSSSWRDALNNDWLILGAIIAGHSLAFVLVAARVIPDAGNTPVSYVGFPVATGWALHASVMLAYVAVFATAAWIDSDFDRLVRRNEVALRDAAQKEALLSTARAELDRALAGETGGLFTGSTLGGYSVEKLIGRGGMGEVYEARRDGTAVALKVIRADRLSSPETLRRFAREASTLQKVESPYVSRVLEVGSDERVPFLAMELVEGATLAELLRESERLDDASARAMIRDISRGLEDVHCAGVLHRDVKPSNLVRTRSGQWKLVDFGIAKFLDGPSETTGNLVVGTPPFMAPEQLTGRNVDERADVFSLCAVIYRALVGRPAWTTQTALAAVRTQPADPRETLRGDIALALRIGLATRPADRFATSIELGAAFDAAFQDRLDEGYRRRAHAVLAREPWS
jgi:serine/threonine protein kinase